MPKLKIKAIDIPEDRVSAPDGAINELALDMVAVGLLNPIVVSTRPDSQDRYWLVAGRRRIYAAMALGWEEIDANVLSLDAERRELAELSENLQRCQLIGAVRDRALKRYADIYAKLHPEVVTFAKQARMRNLRQNHADNGAARLPDVDKLSEVIARREGVALRTVQAAIRRGAGITDDDAIVLDARAVTQEQRDRLVSIGNKDRRREVINLIAQNVEFEEAFRDVGVYGVRTPKLYEPKKPPPPLTPTVRSRVDTRVFDADALLFRHVQKALYNFSKEIDWPSLRKTVAGAGPFYAALSNLLNALSSDRWQVCHACSGKGEHYFEHVFPRKHGVYACESCISGCGYVINRAGQ